MGSCRDFRRLAVASDVASAAATLTAAVLAGIVLTNAALALTVSAGSDSGAANRRDYRLRV